MIFNSPRKMPKVKIVALVKNEAYFLPIWIFHHFYYGIDAIDVYVNRTEDNTCKVLDILKEKYKNLNVYNADAYDKVLKKNVNLQMLIYANSYYNNPDYDYIMYIDADEFFYPRQVGKNIHSMLEDLDFPEHLLLEWYCIDGATEYAHPLGSRREYKGHISQLGKSVIKTGLDIGEFHPHIPEFNGQPRSCLVDGQAVEIDKNLDGQFISSELQDGFKNYFLIHDWMRSPVFYLASLNNGLPSRDNNLEEFKKLKSNRPIYNLNVGKNILNFIFYVNDDYVNALALLLEDNLLKTELIKAKIFKYQQALGALDILLRHPDEKLTKNIVSTFGSLEVMRDKVFVDLIHVEEALRIDMSRIPIAYIR